MQPFEFETRTRLVFGRGSVARVGEICRQLGFARTLLVCDAGLISAGHERRVRESLEAGGISVKLFSDFCANPDTSMIERGRAAAAGVDSFIGLGGGSSLDCAKGINFVYTNGGRMKDYHGWGKASKPLLPAVGIPTTSGTGSEAQSYALISDSETHIKMACGAPTAAFRVAILDPELAVSQPVDVRAVTGYDAISHAVESFVTTRRNVISECFSREAWRLLSANYLRVLKSNDVDAMGAMQLGAWFAGLAIENSMLGAAHACANPLTAHYGTAHGIAIASVLSHVVRWNGAEVSDRYRELHLDLPAVLEDFAAAGGLATRIGAPEHDLPLLASDAAGQWTGRFNPRTFDAAGALEIYRSAL
jgi:alcohol dehydrogenase